MKKSTKLEKILEAYPESTFIKVDGNDDCIIGVADLFNEGGLVLAYDSNKIINKIIKKSNITREEATEYFDFNIAGSRGNGYPIHIDTIKLY